MVVVSHGHSLPKAKIHGHGSHKLSLSTRGQPWHGYRWQDSEIETIRAPKPGLVGETILPLIN